MHMGYKFALLLAILAAAPGCLIHHCCGDGVSYDEYGSPFIERIFGRPLMKITKSPDKPDDDRTESDRLISVD